jgi:hypothetical protein
VSDTTPTGSARHPHYGYAQAVALVDGPGGAYEPDEWNVDVADSGVLFATFYFRRTAPMRIEGRLGYPDGILDPVVNGEHWPHGLALSWDTADGWTYTPILDEFSTVGEHWDPLPVDLLASPAALRDVLVQLFDGHEDELPASTDRWDEPRAATLAERITAAALSR